jgi:hypothetical protein
VLIKIARVMGRESSRFAPVYLQGWQGGAMRDFGISARFIAAMLLSAGCALGAPAQAQPDAQGGAQLGEQGALSGKQDQGSSKPKADEPSGATTFAAGTVISVELTSSLDSKKLKQGDAVNARTVETLKSTDGRTIIPRGTKITGHVIEASVKGAGQSEASLGLAFENAVMKNGEQMPLHVTIQALTGPANNSSDADRSGGTAPLSGTAQGAGTAGTMGRGGVSSPSTLPGTQGNGGIDPSGSRTTGVDDGANGSRGADPLSPTSHGVIGLKNLTLSEKGDGTQGSVIHSTNKNVHLDSGTRLILVTQASG